MQCESRFRLFSYPEPGCVLRCILERGHDGYHIPDPESGAGHDAIGWTDALAEKP